MKKAVACNLMQNTNTKRVIRFPGRPEDLLRFQVNLLSLAEKRYDILHDEKWIESFTQYQLQLYRLGYTEFSHEILQSLGESCVCATTEYREKSLFILTVFLSKVIEEADEELLQALSWIFLRWLYLERELLACSEYVCSMLPAIPAKLLAKGMFAQYTAWLELLQKMSSGQLERPAALQALAARMKNVLLGQFLDRDLALKPHPDFQPDSEMACLVEYLTKDSASILIQELYHSRDKERRLALIETLGQLGDEVAVHMFEQLGEDASWYMVRNALQVIAYFDNKKHLELVLPFLKYPDLRVQQQVIDFICGLEKGDQIRLLIHALEICHDRLKSTVVELLAATRHPEIERALVNLLESRHQIEQWSRDHLLLAVCESLEPYPSSTVTDTLTELIAEREQENRLGDPVLSAARKIVLQLSVSESV